MHTNMLDKQDEVGLLDLVSDTAVLFKDVSYFLDRPEVHSFLINASICLTFIASLALVLKIVAGF